MRYRYGTNVFGNKLAVLALFVGVSLVLFSSSTGRIFVSDDYCTLMHVSKGRIFLPSFFRPAGDLTLSWNLQLTGWDPFYVFVSNILLHAANSFLVYLFCMKWFNDDERRIWYSMIAGLLFLTYPSHSEAILWAIGRGISLAVFFCLMAMVIRISEVRKEIQYAAVCVFYFLALASYESALLLPFILFALSKRETRRQTTIWALLLLTTLFIHLWIRYSFTGGIWRAYNAEIFSKDLVQYLDAFIKIVLRLFVPPFNHPYLFTALGLMGILAIVLAIYGSRKWIEKDVVFIKTLAMILTGVLATVGVAMLFGVSTRTSEGDRLLYFPSVFYCMLIALVIVRLINSSPFRLFVAGVVLTFQCYFLMVSVHHWRTASGYAVQLINGVSKATQRPLYLVNLPSDYKGAFIFRNCFKEALEHYGIDTAGVHIVNVVRSRELDRSDTLIKPQKTGSNVFIWPETLLEIRHDSVVSVSGEQVAATAASFMYWNRKELVPVR